MKRPAKLKLPLTVLESLPLHPIAKALALDLFQLHLHQLPLTTEVPRLAMLRIKNNSAPTLLLTVKTLLLKVIMIMILC